MTLNQQNIIRNRSRSQNHTKKSPSVIRAKWHNSTTKCSGGPFCAVNLSTIWRDPALSCLGSVAEFLKYQINLHFFILCIRVGFEWHFR